MLCRLPQQWMTLRNLEWPFHITTISAVAELLVIKLQIQRQFDMHLVNV